MPGDGLDEIEQQAESRRRGRQAGASRNGRGSRVPVPTKEEREAAEERARQEELVKRESERQARAEKELREREVAEESARRERDAADAEEPNPPELPESDSVPDKPKQARPKSIPFYLDQDNEDFLWEIAKEAVERQEKIPATAVLRLALRRLQDQMSPARIVQELSVPVPTEGKKGRPRK